MPTPIFPPEAGPVKVLFDRPRRVIDLAGLFERLSDGLFTGSKKIARALGNVPLDQLDAALDEIWGPKEGA